jgi:hypothetical protein
MIFRERSVVVAFDLLSLRSMGQPLAMYLFLRTTNNHTYQPHHVSSLSLFNLSGEVLQRTKSLDLMLTSFERLSYPLPNPPGRKRRSLGKRYEGEGCGRRG